jgi:hypothetical protein
MRSWATLAAHLQRSHTLKTVQTFHLKLVFLEVFCAAAASGGSYLRRGCRWARDSGQPR